MNGQQLLAADLLAVVLCAAAWLAAATTAATGRQAAAKALIAGAGLATLARIGVVAALGGHGWWFVQDKVVLSLPLVLAAGLVAVVTALRSGVARAVVPLFAAGYAALAGLLTTYPMTVAQALVITGVLATATLLTWRLVTPSAARRYVRIGAAVALATALAGAALGFVPATAPHPQGRPVAELRGPTEPAPGGEVRRFELEARQATITLTSGRQLAAWTYNGTAPGPVLTATKGDLVEVRLTNVDITDGVTLHWHGYDVANAEDGAPGVTQDAVLPGQEYVYRFLADQVGTYWYHTHQVSDLGVRLGLFGTLVVTDAAEPAGFDLTLPVHTFEGTVVLGVNDGVAQHIAPVGTAVRLRLINTDSTPHRFALSGTAFRVAAVDGNDLNEPGEQTDVALRLPAGGRYDVAFTMPANPVALHLNDSMRLSIGDGREADTADWPELDLTTYGKPLPVPFSTSDRDFTLVLDRGLAMVEGVPAYAHTVNGKGYPSIPDTIVREGDVVRFTVVNRGFETHPWHLHGHRVLVLTKNGRPVTGSPLLLDTFDVQPGEVWQVAFRAGNPGVWMNHCHNLSHADQGMALHLSYEGVQPGGGHH